MILPRATRETKSSTMPFLPLKNTVLSFVCGETFAFNVYKLFVRLLQGKLRRWYTKNAVVDDNST